MKEQMVNQSKSVDMINNIISLFNKKMPEASLEQRQQILETTKEMMKLLFLEEPCGIRFYDELKKVVVDQS